MKIVFLLFALLPLTGFADDKTTANNTPISKSECDNANNSSGIQKGCLLEEKQRAAAENFQNFQVNNHVEKTF